jgi:cyclophilin family peptidyl-prolyl cis-trans isomerase
MARSQDPDSAGSQFFIVLQDSYFLDGQYTVFGRVISGMDIVDKISSLKTDSKDAPIDPDQARMITVTVRD